jgi:hypothetical protein
VHPFRIAILLFLVGASVANYFAMKQYDDRFAARVQQTPIPQTRVNPNDPFGSPIPVIPDPWAVPSPSVDPYTAPLESAARDKAWMREAIIVTIAGVAWFLVRAKGTS